MEEADVPEALTLMKDLAEYEGYANKFRVTEQTLKQKCLEQQSFGVLVADVALNHTARGKPQGTIQGMLVYFFQPFTYDLSPWLVVKELYVTPAFRSCGLGRCLMQKAANICQQAGGMKMKWEVLTNNRKAQVFYQGLGAKLEDDWRTMSLSDVAIEKLLTA